jgi:uncharacterized protein (TIGR03435 family)
MKPIFALAILSAVASGQAGPKLEFEVASIRPSQTSPDARVDVGLRLDGSQAHIASLTLRDYLAMAYGVKAYQISGPDWIASDRFDLSAKLPAGSNSGQIPEMLQTFLAERFGLKYHRDQKELPVYALILGKTPLKLQKSAPGVEGTETKGAVNVSGSGSADGVSVNMGNGSYYTFKDGKFEIKKVTMAMLANVLERYVDRPMLDMTGLEGEYDLSVAVTEEDYRTMLIRAAVSSGSVLPPQALRLLDTGSIASLIDGLQQLGLKMDARKAPLDMIVVDQVLKIPTAN